MIGLDTNVIVRYVVQDDPLQAPIATRLIESACTPESPGHIATVVLAELVWVLGGAYGLDRGAIAAVIRRILRSAELTVEDPPLAWAALRDYERGRADFADGVIGQGNHARGCRVTYTFDRKAAQTACFELAA